jgi:hypothetical protein
LCWWIQLFHSLNHSKSLLLLACVSCIWHVNPKSLFKPQILPNPCSSLKSTTYLASFFPHSFLHQPPIVLVNSRLPSGKRLHNYGKSPFLMGKSTINTHFQ